MKSMKDRPGSVPSCEDLRRGAACACAALHINQLQNDQWRPDFSSPRQNLMNSDLVKGSIYSKSGLLCFL